MSDSRQSSSEPLEPRRLMSASLSDSGVLYVYGTNNADSISVTRLHGSDTLALNDNGVITHFSPDDITQIRVYGQAGNDSILAQNAVAKPLYLYGSDGNDTLRGGGSDDHLFGQNGNDSLEGLNANDYLSGGTGTDTVDFSSATADLTITLDDVANDSGVGVDDVRSDVENVKGGYGDDRLYGSPAANYLEGGGGADDLFGYDGNDTLQGGVAGAGSAAQEDADDYDYLKGGEDDDILYASDFAKCSLFGEAGADSLYGYAGNDYLMAGSGDDWVFAGNGNDSVRGGDGDDRLYGQVGKDSLWGENDDDYLHGGDNEDELFGGSGIDTLQGGNHNDTLVSTGGGQSDELWGESGTDNFWLDSELTETTDATASESSAGNVHRISSFMTYRFTNGSPNWQNWNYIPVSRELTGQSLADPDNGSNYQDFSSNPLFSTSGPSKNDIDQGGLADCYFLAPLSAVAKANSGRIRNSVVSLGDGTYAVRFYNQDADSVYVRVDGDLPTSGGNLAYAGLGIGNSIWVAVMEKAWAFYRNYDADYDSIANGSSAELFGALGAPATSLSVNSTYKMTNTANDLWDYVATQLWNGKAMTCGTPDTPPNLVGSHSYMIDNVTIDQNGNRFITLRNPWGAAGDPSAYVTLSATQFYNNINVVRHASA